MSADIPIISKTTIKRLIYDVKEILRCPLISQGIYYQHDETDILKGYAMIIGPEGTPYENGFYLFKFEYPINYPFSPPTVTFYTGDGITRFNPNLYKSGKVCVSILNTWTGEQWTSCQTISSVLIALCTLLTDKPLLNEPGINARHKDFESYNEIIQFKNIEIAICSMVDKTLLHPSFELFYDTIVERFCGSYETVLKKINDNITVNKTIKTSIYLLEVNVNYNYLLHRIKECKNKCNINEKIELKLK